MSSSRQNGLIEKMPVVAAAVLLRTWPSSPEYTAPGTRVLCCLGTTGALDTPVLKVTVAFKCATSSPVPSGSSSDESDAKNSIQSTDERCDWSSRLGFRLWYYVKG